MKIGVNHGPKNTKDTRVHDTIKKFQSNLGLRDFFNSLTKKELEEFDIVKKRARQDNLTGSFSAESFTFVGSDGKEIAIGSKEDWPFDDINGSGIKKSLMAIFDQDVQLDFEFEKFAHNPFMRIVSLGFRFEKIVSMTKQDSRFSMRSAMHGLKKEYRLETSSAEGDSNQKMLSPDEATSLCDEFTMHFERLLNEVTKKKEAIAAVLGQQ